MLALIFDSVGAGEWLVLLAVLLIVMGPKRLPATARKLGAYYSKFRRAADSFKRQIMEMDYELEREARRAEQELEEAAKIPDEPATDPLKSVSPEQSATPAQEVKTTDGPVSD